MLRDHVNFEAVLVPGDVRAVDASLGWHRVLVLFVPGQVFLVRVTFQADFTLMLSPPHLHAHQIQRRFRIECPRLLQYFVRV